MEWSIQVATGYQRAINWQGVEMAIKSLLDLYIGPRLIGQLVLDNWKQNHHLIWSTMVGSLGGARYNLPQRNTQI